MSLEAPVEMSMHVYKDILEKKQRVNPESCTLYHYMLKYNNIQIYNNIQEHTQELTYRQTQTYLFSNASTKRHAHRIEQLLL